MKSFCNFSVIFEGDPIGTAAVRACGVKVLQEENRIVTSDGIVRTISVWLVGWLVGWLTFDWVVNSLIR